MLFLAGDRISAAFISSVSFMCEIVTANVCLFQLNVAYLASTTADSKTGEKENCRIFSRTIHFGHSTK